MTWHFVQKDVSADLFEHFNSPQLHIVIWNTLIKYNRYSAGSWNDF